MADDAELSRAVRAVVAIIGRDRAREAEIEQAIRWARRPTNPHWPWPPHPLTKADKRTARSIASALRRLEWALGCNPEEEGKKATGWAATRVAVIEAVIGRATDGAHDDFSAWKAQLKAWRRCFEAFGGTLKIDGPHSFLPSDGDGWPLGHRTKRTEQLVRKRAAAAAAAAILKAHRIPLKTTRPISGVRPGSTFCRVAAAIYGAPRADLAHHCRALIEARKRGRS